MRKIGFISAFILWSVSITANGLDKAWAVFADNKLEEAKTLFLSSKAEDKAESYLGLSLICQMEEKDEEAFKYFKQFFATSKSPYPQMFALWNTSSVALFNSKLKKERVEFLEQLIKDEKTNGTIKAMAYQSLTNHYLASNKLDVSKKLGANIGAVDKWLLLGEFENISASGYNKDFGALNHPEREFQFKNKSGAEVSWFPIEGLRNDFWLDYEFYFMSSNSIIYAQTFVESSMDRTVELRLGTSGSYKIWLNDKLVSETEIERNNDMDTYNSRVKLKKGFNRILIQIGESIVDNSNFLLRVTDEMGSPIKDLIYHNEVKPYVKDNTNEPSIAVPIFAEQYFEDQVKKSKDGFIDQILLVNSYLRNQKTFEARKIIKEMEKKWPNSLYLLSVKNQAYNQDKNYSGSSAIYKKMKEIDSNSLFALQLDYQEQYSKDNFQRAEEISLKLSKQFDAGKESEYMRKINLASKNKQVELLQKIILEAQKKYPDNLTFVSLKYEVEKELKKNKEMAMKTLIEFLKNNDNDNVTTSLASDYFQSGKLTQGIELYKKLIKDKPYAVGYYSTLANIYFEMGAYEESKKIANMAIQRTPTLGGLYSILGKANKEIKKESEAIDNFKKSIYYNPLDYDSREQLNKLQKKPVVFSNFIEPKYDELSKLNITQKDYPNDHSYILCEDVQTVVYKGGISEEKHFIMVKTLNASGVDYWKEYDIDLAGSEQLKIEDAFIIKKNGTKVDAESNEYRVVYRNLEEGDNICLTYKVYHFYTGKLAEHFWDRMIFNKFLPSKSIKYSLLIDKNEKFQWKISNGNFTPEVKEIGENKLYIWERKDQPALKSEQFMPSSIDIGEVLNISTIPDWDYVSKWYTDLAITKTKPDFEVKEVVEELFKDKLNLNKEQKVKEIYQFITKNIRYSSISFRQSGLIPQRPADVLNTKIGDCKDVSCLFVAMCKEVDIDANLVLVATRNYGDDQMPLPSIDFNHCIAAIELNGQKNFVELTSDNYPFATYNTNLLKAPALEIVKEKTDLIRINPNQRKLNIRERKSVINFEGDKMIVLRKVKKTGSDGAGMREVYRDKGQEEREKILKESLADEYPTIKLEKFEFDEGLNKSVDTIAYSFTYSVPQKTVFQEVAGLNIMKMVWSDEIQSLGFINDEVRLYPIELYNLMNLDIIKETIVMKMPVGKILAQKPNDVILNSEFAEYALTFVLKGDEMTATRTLRAKMDIVPANKFQEIKQFFESIIKADKTNLAFKSK